MRKLFVVFMLFLLPIFLFAGQGDFYNGYTELLADDTLSMDLDICQLNSWGDGTAEWSTTRDTFGDYSVKITTTTDDWDSLGQVRVFANRALDSIAADADIHFWIYNECATQNCFPVLYIDTTGGSTVNFQLHSNRIGDNTKNLWVNSAAGYQNTWIPHAYDKDKPTGTQDGRGAQNIAYWNAAWSGAANLIYVALQFGKAANGVLYVDDIQVNNDTFEIEPALAYDLTATTTILEQFSDTLYFNFALLAKEIGPQDSEVDIRLQYSPDGSNWSAAEILESDLDIGTTAAEHQWYFPKIGGCADGIYSMKNVKVIIDNSGYYTDNTNKIVIESFGIAFKKEQ